MRILLLIYFLTAYLALQAQPLYLADSNRQVHNLEAFTYVMVDVTGQLKTADVISGKLDSSFIPLHSLQEKKISGVYWMHCRLEAKSPFHQWRLVLKDSISIGHTSLNDYADVFYTGIPGQLPDQHRTGVLVPLSQKAKGMPAGFNGVLFSAAKGQVVNVYIRIKNLYSSPVSRPVLEDPALPYAHKAIAATLPALSAIAGIFCILSLFFFFFIKERAYLVFAMYTFVLSQHYLILHPDIPFTRFYIPQHPELLNGLWLLFTYGGFVFFCLFGYYFMNLRKLSKTTGRLYMYFIIAFASVTTFHAVWQLLFLTEPFPNIYIGLWVLPCALAFFVRFALFKDVIARLFVGGAVWLMVFTIMGFIWSDDIPLPFNPWPIGQVGQLLIFTIGLAYKVRLNAMAKAEADRIKGLDEIKSRFFANISHEFRTPLSLIQGPLQQMEEHSANKEGEVSIPYRYVRTMRKHTDRLLELVNQLLDLSRLDSGKMKLQLVKADVMQLLKAIAASFESVAERKQIHYHVHITEQAAIVFHDKDKLEKIFTNLLANAFKYTPAQGTVAVIADIEDNKLRLTIEDDGPGIAKKELDKVFDRFYQVEGNEDKGSGIGLALVKELVDLYRGQISVSAEPGKGSRFRISLPVDIASFKEEELLFGSIAKEEKVFINMDTDEFSAAHSNTSPGLPLLLLAEDNNDLRLFMCDILQPHYKVIEATNGQECFENAIAEVPDIIVSDVMMPLVDGFQLTARLKKDERTSHIPVILLTAKAGQQHRMEGLETGADDYLTKPVDVNELMIRIDNLVKQRKLLRKKFAGKITLRPSEVSVSSAEEIFLEKLMKIVEANMEDEDFGVEELAKALAMSRSQVHRKLVAVTGRSAGDIIRNARLLRAKELLQQKAYTPSEVAYKVGFNSHTYFSKCFKEEFGLNPSEVK